MIKVNNKKIILGIAKKEYLANRRKNILTVFAIMLTTFMITTICSMGGSYWNAITKRSISMEGMKYDVQLPNPTKKQMKKANQIHDIKYAGLSVKCAVTNKVNGYSTMIKLFWRDNINWEKQCIPAFEFMKGTYPDKQDEIVMSTKALKDVGIWNPKIGMKLDVSYDSLGKEGGTKEKQFTLSGYYRDYTGGSRGFVSKTFYEKTGVKQTDYGMGFLNISLKNPIYSKQDINLLRDELGMKNNQMIFADFNLWMDFIKFLGAIIGLFLLIMVSGYLFIYNILYISVSKEVRFFGQLKTIGMTSKQIKGIVQKQVMWNTLIGIPLGLALGTFVSYYIVPYILHIANKTLRVKEEVVFHPIVYAGAILFSFITVYISCKEPAKIAGEIAPIEAAKYEKIRFVPKQKRSRNGGKLTYIAWRNMFRNKKQAVIILLSFFLSITVLISVNSIVKSNSAKNVLNHFFQYDIRLLNTTILKNPEVKFNESDLKRLESIEGILSIRKIITSDIYIPYHEGALKGYYDRLSREPFITGDFTGELKEYKADKKCFIGKMVGIDENGFDVFNEESGSILDKKEFMEGKVAIISRGFGISVKEAIGKTLNYTPCEGAQEYSIEIAAEWDIKGPDYFAAGWSPNIIVSDKLAKEILKNPKIELIDIDYVKSFSRTMDRKIKKLFGGDKEISFDSKLSGYEEKKQSENRIRVFGGGLGIILASLTVLNYGNMMATSIQTRVREFAILQSIGMTEKQIKKMIQIEGIGYGLISMGISIFIGGPVSYMIFKATDQYGLEMQIPVVANIVVFICIMLVCTLVPRLVYRIVQKKNSIVEQIQETY